MWPFKKKNDLSKEIDRVYEIVVSKIHSKRVAKQFILEELDAASQGDDKAKMLVSQSGFGKSEYKNAMQNSFEEVDGPRGPQQALLRECMTFEDKGIMVEVRVSVVEKIIDQYNNGNFDNKGNNTSGIDLTDTEQKIAIKLLKIKALKGQEEAINLFKIIEDKDATITNLPNIVSASILQSQNVKKLIDGEDHSSIRNLMYFLEIDQIDKLLKELSNNSVTELVVGMVFQDKKYWNTIRETVEKVAHPMFSLVLDSITDDLYFVAIGLSHEKMLQDKDFYEEIFS